MNKLRQLRLHRIENEVFESNTFVIWKEGANECYLIDCGDAEKAICFAETKDISIKGILLTHGHFDHIYGLNLLKEKLLLVSIYCSEYAKQQLFDKKT